MPTRTEIQVTGRGGRRVEGKRGPDMSFGFSPRARLGRWGIGAALLAVLLPFPASALTASDVCAVNADPCSVTSRFDVAAGDVLDFGTRAVTVSGSGQFNFGRNSGSILCGPFSASTSGAAIDANGPGATGGSDSGTVVLHARRRCLSGNLRPPCIDSTDCQLGACNTRRCSKRPTRTCTADENCQAGTCGTNRRCTGSVSILRCDTNADCDFGTCPVQLTCANRGSDPVACSTNGDCDFGACSVGSASINLGGSIVGNSDSPASIELRAADSVSISKLINLSSTSSQSDGGELLVEAAAGSVTLTAKITATGGGQSQGGVIDISAGTDVTLSEEINVAGGDFDGGSVDVRSGRDIAVHRSILANSVSAGGFGGEVLLEAERDLALTSASSSNKTTMETNGHTSVEGFAGDGGTQDLSAGRHLSLGANTRLVGRGSTPDGSGSDIFVGAEESLSMSGDVTARADGPKGGGGAVEVDSGAPLTVNSGATFDLTGGEGGGGSLLFGSRGPVAFGGTADVSGGVAGPGGSAFIDADADVSFTGTWTMSGIASGEFEIGACRITLGGTGKLDNKVANGSNRLTSRESMKLLAGSLLKTGASGTNTLVYRAAAKPPVQSGTVSPAASLVLDPTLAGCPVCGNAEVDQGETCDDGNLVDGDGCSSLCQNEKCLAQTPDPGYPAVPLCDDGKPCTEDFCNTNQNGGTCRHRAKTCDDGIACTADSCHPVSGECVAVPNDGACDDDNVCTQDFCSVSSGCSTVASTAPCDDGDSCTEGDQCIDSQCVGMTVPSCAVCGDGVAAGDEECDDGNATFTFGEYCGEGCRLIPCGKPTNSTGTAPRSSDALFTLRAAVGQATCSPRVCDADGNGNIVASDAQRILRAAVGQNVVLQCPVE
ncbi:MAG: hypothetical protein ABR538_06635 [Candidatus Binatia bacterium]